MTHSYNLTISRTPWLCYGNIRSFVDHAPSLLIFMKFCFAFNEDMIARIKERATLTTFLFKTNEKMLKRHYSKFSYLFFGSLASNSGYNLQWNVLLSRRKSAKRGRSRYEEKVVKRPTPSNAEQRVNKNRVSSALTFASYCTVSSTRCCSSWNV